MPAGMPDMDGGAAAPAAEPAGRPTIVQVD